MQVLYCDTFALPLPDSHRFPMDKYRLPRERGAPASLAALPAARR